jgi:Skp family chaperone for outer membrane proteins
MIKPVLACFLSLVTLTSYAQPKIATVDVRKVLGEYHKKKAAETNLKERAADFEKARKEMMDGYQQLNKKYKESVEGANDQAVSATERENRKKAAETLSLEIKKTEQEINDFVRRTETTLDEQRRRVLDTLLREIREVISTTAKAQNYTWVLNSSGVGGDNIPDFLYSSGAYDLTEVVIKQLNANAPEESLKTNPPEGNPRNPEKVKK